MGNTIRIEFEGNKYTLEYNRETISFMERARGFNLEEIGSKPATMIPILFEGAFLKNHKHLKADIPKKIFAKISNKQELHEKLLSMYVEALECLYDTEDGDEGNVTWEAN